MNPVARGIRNPFRNGVRSLSIIVILGISIGLALTMLIAQKAVDSKIKNVKSSIGNTISIAPAGFNPGSQANNALTTGQLSKVRSLSHVTTVTETLTDRQATTGSSTPTFGRFGDSSSSSNTTTSLTSPTVISVDQNRSGSGNGFHIFVQDGGSLPANFSLPVSFLGTNQPSSVSGTGITISKGNTIDPSADTNDALISQAMATKNNLSVGSTFTAYNATLNVKGIFTGSTRVADDTVVLALPALQRLSGQAGAVTSATVTVDSLDNLSSVTTAVKDTLGSSADVTSAEEQADNTIKPLGSVKTVSTFSLIGAIIAGAVIILLVMVMVVRERKKEIGVVKAIGGSTPRIVGEFMVESLTLAVLGAVIGLLIGVVGGQPITKTLVDNSTSTSSTQSAFQRPNSGTGSGSNTDNRPAFGGGFGQGFRRNGAVRSLGNIKTQIGPEILLEGFGAAVLIALIGSALAAGMISKVRPATVMRAD